MMRFRRLFMVLVAVLCTAFALAALAAPRSKKSGGSSKSGEKSRKHSSSRARAAEKKRAAAEARMAGDAGATGPRNVGAGADAGLSTSNVKESKQTDAGSSYKFGELEIEGRLKTPQIVYFLRRVRAEFAAQDLGHRSFTGELRETRKEPSF